MSEETHHQGWREATTEDFANKEQFDWHLADYSLNELVDIRLMPDPRDVVSFVDGIWHYGFSHFRYAFVRPSEFAPEAKEEAPDALPPQALTPLGFASKEDQQRVVYYSAGVEIEHSLKEFFQKRCVQRMQNLPPRTAPTLEICVEETKALLQGFKSLGLVPEDWQPNSRAFFRP